MDAGPIELTVEYKRLNAFFADYTKNIGRGGTFIRTEKALPIGTEFTFKLVIPTLPEPIRIRGRCSGSCAEQDGRTRWDGLAPTPRGRASAPSDSGERR